MIIFRSWLFYLFLENKIAETQKIFDYPFQAKRYFSDICNSS